MECFQQNVQGGSINIFGQCPFTKSVPKAPSKLRHVAGWVSLPPVD